MVDFGKLADDAKAKQDAVAVGDAEIGKQNRTARAAAVDKAVAALVDHVAPLIEKAKRDFSARGIESRVVTAYDVKNFKSRNPTLSFSCLSPPRESDQYRLESTAAVFSSDGASIFVAFKDGNSLVAFEKKEPDQTPVEGCEATVVAAIGAVVGHYYEMMRTQAYHLK